jgi:hypothetical protein
MRTNPFTAQELAGGGDGAATDAISDITREALAAMFLTCVRQELRSGHAPTLEAAATASRSDVGLTAASDGLDAPGSGNTLEASGSIPGTGAAGSNPEAERLEFELDGGKLGRLALGLLRRNGAIEVVVGVEDPRQMALVDLERASLLATLKSAGLNIASVTVMSREAAGTAFAQRKRGMNATHQELASEAYRNRSVRQETDTDEGVDLVG